MLLKVYEFLSRQPSGTLSSKDPAASYCSLSFLIMSQNGVRGGTCSPRWGKQGGHDIHRWNRLVLYIMGKLVNKSVQQHRGHGRSFSISTNQKPVFDQDFGYAMTANLQPSYLGQFNSDFDAVKSKVGLFYK